MTELNSAASSAHKQIGHVYAWTVIAGGGGPEPSTALRALPPVPPSLAFSSSSSFSPKLTLTPPVVSFEFLPAGTWDTRPPSSSSSSLMVSWTWEDEPARGEGTVRPRPRSRSRAYWRWRGWFPLFRSTLQTLVHIGGHVAAGTGPSPSPSPRGSTRRREGQITRNESRQSTRRTRSCPPVRPSRHHYSIPTHTTHTTTHTTHTTHIATRRARWGRQVRIFVHILVNDTDSIRMRF